MDSHSYVCTYSATGSGIFHGTASCLFASMDKENRLQKWRERERRRSERERERVGGRRERYQSVNGRGKKGKKREGLTTEKDIYVVKYGRESRLYYDDLEAASTEYGNH